MEREVNLIAEVAETQPANQKWYLPLAGREETLYDSREQAERAADHICPTVGLPTVTPLSVDLRMPRVFNT